MSFPLPFDSQEWPIKWSRHTSESVKLNLIAAALDTYPDYASKAILCKRPEEIDQSWLYVPVWRSVNDHYRHLGIKAQSHQELVEQLGILRYGQRPRVGDTFCGGGSIPFEAARLGCDVYASDLNPIACMLTWGALNIIGASPEKRQEIERAQKDVAAAVDTEIYDLGIEHDKHGNRAKAYLYCLETRCPETGWMVPMAPSWVISKTRNVIAKLSPDYDNKRFDIEVLDSVSATEMKQAEKGTVQNGSLVYTLDGKTYNTPIKTIRGDYKDDDGSNRNRLRQWSLHDFKPQPDDIFQERLYAVQWISADTIDTTRPETFFAAVTEDDEIREQQVDALVAENLTEWQADGLVPDMAIDPGDKTDEPIRTRGWTHWHHLFNARNLLYGSYTARNLNGYSVIGLCDLLNFNAKACRWTTSPKSSNKPGGRTGGASDNATDVFSNQALNTFYNYAHRSLYSLLETFRDPYRHRGDIRTNGNVDCRQCSEISDCSQIWITDPPYADAVHYHEITEFFIAWLRKNPPAPFDEWTWDSRRSLAIKGSGDEFRQGMVEAYTAMANHMPDNGRQCVMFTHQDAGVWSDMVGIFWAAGLQVTAAWYIATETTSELKKGGYVQGTVTLLLQKRPPGEKAAFVQQLLPTVRREVERQIEQMMHLNDNINEQHGEPVFNDSDLQMAGYAAALKVLTAFTKIGGEDVTGFALKPRKKGETTVVDTIVQQAAEAANSVLVPEGLDRATWEAISGVQRFYLRMLDMETTGASKLDNYQNFAKAFRVDSYTSVMASTKANAASLKQPEAFESRDLSDNTEMGATRLGRLIIGIQQLRDEVDPQVVVQQISEELPDFLAVRQHLVNMLRFMQVKLASKESRDAAELLADRLQNLRALGQ